MGGLCALLLLEEHVVEEGEVVIVRAGRDGVLLAAGRFEGHALLQLVLQFAIDGFLLGAGGGSGVAGFALEGVFLGAGCHHRAAPLAVVVLTLHLQILYCGQQISRPSREGKDGRGRIDGEGGEGGRGRRE